MLCFALHCAAPWDIEDRARLLAELGPLTNDDDRYVMAAAVEAVRRLTALASPFVSNPDVLYGERASASECIALDRSVYLAAQCFGMR